jgi:hypothetical protein
MTRAKGAGRRKQQWLNLTCYPNIFLEVLRKITEYPSISAVPAKINKATPERNLESVPLKPTCSFAQYYLRHNDTNTIKELHVLL